MRLHLTFPGRAGDLLWALPTIRAISEAAGQPLDLSICGEFRTIIPLLKAGCPYLGEITAHDHWRLVPPREWDAPLNPVVGERLVHLGYRGWPHTDLPHCVYEQVQKEYPDIPLAPLDLERPWIEVEPSPWMKPDEVVAGWTEVWFELKVGILWLLQERVTRMLATPGSRWVTQCGCSPVPWLEAAQRIHRASVFLGDCSALHVLALAIGRPCVLVEPMQDRLNDIFWPMGKDGPRVTLVRGLDGQATHDARHCAETLQRVLSGLQRASV
jgi:hypothetical protein